MQTHLSAHCLLRPTALAMFGLLAACNSEKQAPNVYAKISLSALAVSETQQDWGEPHVNKSVDNHGLSIGGRKFTNGLGTHANSSLSVDLHGKGVRFEAWVGVDDEVPNSPASIQFEIQSGGKSLWKTGVMKAGQAAEHVDLDLAGLKRVELLVHDAGDGINYDHADWADASFEFRDTPPDAIGAPKEEAIVLTPKSGPEPRIHGASIVGLRPGHPFLFAIPATGERPMSFSADGMPATLKLDPATGLVRGSIAKEGTYDVTLHAKNARGSTDRALRIVCGKLIALTPPLGWNSWNCFACEVDDAKVRSAADAMVASGLAQHGWNTVNIDDCWEGERDASGNIQSNKKFPDMHALAEYVHSKGLKIGLYSSPGPKTCAGYAASWQHEEQDAKRYAEWGFDYLKYDWCSYDEIAKGKTIMDFKEPYEVMRAALDKCDRDIVFSLCQYGMGDVWKWGAYVGGNCWRTTGDITDTWSSMSGIGFNQNGHEAFAGPGHWNDPDMLVVGKVGWGSLHPTHLTPNEQYTHISLWCLLTSPLLIGCDMAQLDAFTLGLLTNDEALDVSQDPLGKQAARITKDGDLEVWAKSMQDGSLAVGLFNRGAAESPVSVRWSDLGITGSRKVRDLWRQKDLGNFEGAFSTPVARHGVVLVRVFATQN